MTARVAIELRIDSHRLIVERGQEHTICSDKFGERTAHALARELLRIAQCNFDPANKFNERLNEIHQTKFNGEVKTVQHGHD